MVDIDRLSQALSLMQDALQLIDEAQAPAQLGAHLDLSICRVQDEVSLFTSGPSMIAESMRLGVGLRNSTL
jgi:hypothetical protein